jgi:site-specific DNA-methyltransferase (adenine-specific)
MSNPKWFKYEWIWEKNYGSNFASYKYMPSKEHENILVFGKSKVNYYPIRIPRSEASLKRDPKGTTRQKVNKIWSKKPHPLTGMTPFPIPSPYDIDGMRNPRTIVKFNRERVKEQNCHPTQKPVALLEYLIKTYTVEGELILDNTAGSGSLAIAAINTKRNYICIEKDDDYFQVMSDRIATHDPNAPPPKKSKPRPASKGQLSLF